MTTPIETLFNEFSANPLRNCILTMKDSYGCQCLELVESSGRSGIKVEHNLETYVADFYFYGISNKTLTETIKKLKLPKSLPQNEGERIFWIFNMMLEHEKEKKEINRSFYLVDEKQLEFVFKKLLRVYSGDAIDQEFYSKLKGKTKGNIEKADTEPPYSVH